MVGEKRHQVFAANTSLVFEEMSSFSGLFAYLCDLKERWHYVF